MDEKEIEKKAAEFAANNLLNDEFYDLHQFEQIKQTFIIAYKQALNIDSVINWVAVKEQVPVNKQMVMICFKGELMICGYKGICWQDLNPDYWASIGNIKPPCY